MNLTTIQLLAIISLFLYQPVYCISSSDRIIIFLLTNFSANLLPLGCLRIQVNYKFTNGRVLLRTVHFFINDLCRELFTQMTSSPSSPSLDLPRRTCRGQKTLNQDSFLGISHRRTDSYLGMWHKTTRMKSMDSNSQVSSKSQSYPPKRYERKSYPWIDLS